MLTGNDANDINRRTHDASASGVNQNAGGGMPHFSYGGDYYGVRKDANGIVKSGDLAPAASCVSYCYYVSGSVSRGRQPFFFDVQKGSPNYTIRATYPILNASGTMNYDYFLWQMMVPNPAWDNTIAYTQNGSEQTIPVNETLSGSFDAVSITWNRESPNAELIVYAVAVTKLQ